MEKSKVTATHSGVYNKDDAASVAALTVIATHSGVYHNDDAASVAALTILHPASKVIRTRDEDLLKKADYVIDVGGKYEPRTRRFDNHFPNPPLNDEGIPRCSFSLLIQVIGRDLVESIIGLEVIPVVAPPGEYTKREEFIIRRTFAALKPIASKLDAIDAGHKDVVVGPSDTVRHLIPVPGEPNSEADMDWAFNNAVSHWRDFLRRYIIVAARRAAFQWTFSDLPPKAWAVKLPHGAPSDWWLDSALKAEIDFVYWRSKDGWLAQCVPPSATQLTKQRTPFEKRLRGLKGAELVAATQLPDVTFVHPAGFMAGARSEESLLGLMRFSESNPGEEER